MTNASSPAEGARSLRGARVLVTGAGRRVGAAIARAFGAEGAFVAVHYARSAAGAQATARSIQQAGGRAELFEADLSRPAMAEQLGHAVVGRLGGLDVLVPSAAIFEHLPFEQAAAEDYRRHWELNTLAPLLLLRSTLPALRARRGSVVFVTCSSTVLPYPEFLPYVSAKGALATATRALAVELAPEVRVNAVAPGTVAPPEGTSRQTVERWRRDIPLERIGHPDDVARAVLHLAREPFVTGQTLVVDGGRTAGLASP